MGEGRVKDSKFKLDYIVTENVTDPNVPVGGKLLAFNQK